MGQDLCYNKKVTSFAMEEQFDYSELSDLYGRNFNLEEAEYGTICKKKGGQKFLKEYRILKKIGMGSYGVVYLAQQSVSNSFAVKCINKQRVLQSSSKKSGERLRTEIYIMKTLQSDHIIKLHKLY